MKLILPLILALVGVAAGGYVGYSYVSSQMAQEAAMAEEGAEGDGAADMMGEDAVEAGIETADAAGSSLELDEAAEDSEYLPLSRKLIVPFERENGRKAYVAVDVTLEIGPGETEFVTLHEPKVIDAFIQVLIRFAATGAFEDPGQASDTLRELNAELFSAAEVVLGERIRGVLIAHILTQNE